jgi:putative transposase
VAETATSAAVVASPTEATVAETATPAAVVASPLVASAAAAQAGAAVETFRQALAEEEAQHRDRLKRLQAERSTVRKRPRRRGRAGQQQRRQLEKEVRQQAVAFARELRAAGGSQTQAAALLNVCPRTLRSWDARCQARRLELVPLGRPPSRPEPATRQAVLDVLRETGGQTSVAALQEQFATCARAELTELLGRYRHVLQARYPEIQHVLHWLVPGSVWAIDFAVPSLLGAAALPAIDGRFPYLLAVRDLASGYVLAWLPVTAATAAVTRALLAQLFAQYGPPLLLKLDNGSAFRDAGLQCWLAAVGVFLLYSPPHCPAYNGSIEATIGSLKTRTEHQALLHGRPGAWTSADVLAARAQANLTQPRRLQGSTPAEVWATRRPLTDLERVRFLLTLERQGELTKSATIIPRPLTWSSVQRVGFSGVSLDNRPLPGGTHGCYYYGRLDQVVLSPSERSARRGTFAAFARGHYCVGNLWCHRRLR